MSSREFLTHLEGVDVSQYRVVELSRENLMSAGFEKCPESQRHLLVHAVQFQLPLPSLASMERTERKNKVKAAKGNAKPANVSRPHRQAQRKIKGSRKRLPPAPLPAFVKPRPPTTISPPTSTSAPTAFKICSPEENVLRAARRACQGQLEEWFGKCESLPEEQPLRGKPSKGTEKGKGDKDFPIYFQKKHRSHKRRLRERRELIKANRDKLVELFGRDILSQACKISIKELKIALGLVESSKMDEEAVGEFMAMINEDEERSSPNRGEHSSRM